MGNPPRVSHHKTGGNQRGTQLMKKHGTGFTAITGLSALHDFDEIDTSNSAEHGTIEGVTAYTGYKTKLQRAGELETTTITLSKVTVRQPKTARFWGWDYRRNVKFF